MTFNHRPGRATANKELRQAIQAVFDGDQFVNQVIGIPGYRSTSTLFPHWLKGLEGNFVEDFPPPDVKRGQLRADQLMESARMKLGKISELTLLTVSSPTGARVAEYPDFDDILTYADLLASYNANNRGKFIDAEYDRWLTTLKRSSDLTLRLKAAAELQRIIVDQVPILPTAETASAYLVHPKLKGVARRVIGQDPDYSYARVLP